MNSLERFWLATEQLPGSAAVLSEWQALVGPGFDSVQWLLRPTDRLADSFPRLGDDGSPFPYQVVTHGLDDHVGICPEGGPSISLGRRDLIIYELDLPLLRRCLADSFGLESAAALPVDHRNADYVGAYVPTAGFRFPVFLNIAMEPWELSRAADALAAGQDGPFVLLIPTTQLLTPGVVDLIKRSQSGLLALSDGLTLDGERRFKASSTADTLFASFRGIHVPDARAAPQQFFPTPAGAPWEKVFIRFVDGHTVSIRVGEASGTFNYTQLGMANRKNGNPTVQWELLYIFAKERGRLTWGSRKADRRNQKRREHLARDLRSFFRIEGDPFRTSGNGWEARFSVVPDE